MKSSPLPEPIRSEVDPLARTCVLITRPADQAEGLMRGVEALGGEAVCVPTVKVEALSDLRAARAQIARLVARDIGIFVSSNAVKFAAPLLRDALRREDWPRWVAVGPATAAALREREFGPVAVPAERFDSEGLLALAELSPERVEGRHIVIFKGLGGRPDLVSGFRARAATVTTVDGYRRISGDTGERQRLAEVRAAIDIAVVTSGQGLRNLFAMLGRAHHDLAAGVTIGSAQSAGR